MNDTAVEEPRAPSASPHRRRPSDVVLYSSLVLMVFFWSLNYVAGKFALREFPALLLAGLRTAIAGAMMAPIYAWGAWRRRGKAGWTHSDLGILLALGLFGVALNQFFFVVGLSRTSVAHAAILNGLTPVLVLLIAAAMHLERITAAKALGMLIALCGVVVLHWARAGGTPATLAGDALVFLGSLAFAVFAVLGKRVTGKFGGVTVNAFAYVGGALMLAPLTVSQSAGFDYGGVTVRGWLSILYMAGFSSVVCYLIFYWALAHIPASRVSAFSYLQPLFATLLAIPLLGEVITVPLMLGGALVFAGVLMTERG